MINKCIVKMTSKGQITLPKIIRNKIKVDKGDYLLFRMKGNKIEIEKVDLSWEERFDKLMKKVGGKFKKLGITRKDIEEAIKWARKSS